MEIEAVVTGIEGTDAVVELDRRTGGCGRCHESGGCGGGGSLLGSFFGPRSKTFRVGNPIGAQIGERVLLRLGDREFLYTALAVYLLPAALLVTGAFAGMAVADVPGDIPALAGGLVGFAGGAVAVTFYQARARRLGRCLPVLIRRPLCSDSPCFQD
jgi:sigma-E factor negative regulatory protein RseC